MAQWIMVSVIVLAAVVYLMRQLWRSSAAKDCSGCGEAPSSCGGCSGCPGDQSCNP